MSQAGSTLGTGSSGGPILTLTGNTGGPIGPTLGNINVVGSGSVNVTGSGSTLTISVVNAGFPWSEKAASFNAQIQNGYFCIAALTSTLPTAGLALGNTIIFVVDTSSQVVVQAGAGQGIQIGSGTQSTVTSTASGCVLELVYRPNDGDWHTVSSVGSWV
jgi:hypothetical protein